MEILDNEQIEKHVFETLTYQEELWELFCCGTINRDMYDEMVTESNEQHNNFLKQTAILND